MADPLAGWRILLSLLRPGGLMHLAFYSDVGRGDVAAARMFIAERKFGATPDDIRRCRQELLATPLASVTRFTDFFTTSECRDLLFHVHEVARDDSGDQGFHPRARTEIHRFRIRSAAC